MNLLEINQLKKSFGQKVIVDEISLKLKSGKICGLLGPNGAGKSTLIRSILGLYNFESGSVKWNNENFNFEKHHNIIGYMPEERGLFKKMSCADQIIYIGRLKGLTKSEAIKNTKYWFDRFEIIDWWKKDIEELSKGMSQKLQFIATVVHHPSLLILDEPFSGLDPVNAKFLQDIILSMAKEGCTIMLSTHRMEQVEELCEEFILINEGKKILDGTVLDVKEKFKKGIFEIYTKDDLSTMIFENSDIIEIIGEKYILKKKNNEVAAKDILKELVSKNIAIDKFAEIYPTMQEIFINVISNKQKSVYI